MQNLQIFMESAVTERSDSQLCDVVVRCKQKAVYIY